jgi:hypothetical protein
MNDFDDVFAAFHQLPAPTEGTKDRARKRLLDAIATPAPARAARRRPRTHLLIAAVVAVGVLAAAPALAGVSYDLGNLFHSQPRVRSKGDVVRAFRRSDRTFRRDIHLTPSALKTTHAIFTFPASLGRFPAGISAYRTDLPSGGFCITFEAPQTCTQRLPDRSEPLMGIGVDMDQERAGNPFVLISIKAPDVRTVSYTCAGTTYPTIMQGDVVAFVSPSSTLTPEDCVANIGFADGTSVTEHI